MELIEIPYSPVNLIMFIGEEERSTFEGKVLYKYPEWEASDDTNGLSYLNNIFVEDLDDKEVLLHEIYHFLEWLFEYMEITKESEFKACLFTHIVDSIFNLQNNPKSDIIKV